MFKATVVFPAVKSLPQAPQKGFKPLTPTSNKPIHSKERRPIDNPLIVEPRYGIFAPIEKVAPKKKGSC